MVLSNYMKQFKLKFLKFSVFIKINQKNNHEKNHFFYKLNYIFEYILGKIYIRRKLILFLNSLN